MRDEIDDRLWQYGRKQTSNAIDRLVRRTMQAFCVLHRQQWSAPWSPAKRCRP
ncbi:MULTISPECIES: hypothetical protein [unclassified Sphingobium]|uniref:hypothetical protein n=1 Tax=unclassified Sphingobium TaxID=2611147 RepID=UPI0035A58C81